MPRLLPYLSLLFACSFASQARADAARGVIFIAEGSGDLSATSKNLEAIVCEFDLGLRVERLDWSHGRFRPISDLVKHERHLCWGQNLAASVLAYRRDNPAGRIILVGHSSGAAIILAAAESLPAGCVERIILFAPAVSCGYDLRPALRCSREGVDSFYSKHDPVLFGIFVTLMGTADRTWEPSAGWLGFDGVCDCCGDATSCKLRQHGWSKDLAHTGYLGGHYGCRDLDHLRERVLPLLLAPCVPADYVCTWPAAPPKMTPKPSAVVKAKDDGVIQRVVSVGEYTGMANPRLGLLIAPGQGK